MIDVILLKEQTTVNCENPVCFPNADGSYQCPEVEKFQSGKSCETDPIIGCRQDSVWTFLIICFSIYNSCLLYKVD